VQIHRSPDSYHRPGSARPEYHHQPESAAARLTIALAALAVTRFIQARTGSPIKRFICTARRCRTIPTRGDRHILTTQHPLPPTGAPPSHASMTRPCALT
jgi:hypothetical protein